MNSLILLLLLFCCGSRNGGSSNGLNNGNCGCQNSERDNCCNIWRDCDDGGRNNGRESDMNRECGNNRDENDCGCRQDSRLDSRPFISYPGQGTCGCEAPQTNN